MVMDYHCFDCSYRSLVLTQDEETELHRLVMRKDVNISSVRKLLRAGNPNVKDYYFDTPLHLATIHESNFEIVRELINAGAEVEAFNIAWNTPLHVAVAHRNRKATELLLQKGADVNARNVRENTPLHFAVTCSLHKKLEGSQFQQGEFKIYCKLIIRDLIQAGADVNIANKFHETPLYRAVETGDLDIVKELLKAGADTNICNSDSTSCLHIALSKLNPDNGLLEELVKHGANINYRDIWFRTPLDLAILKYLNDTSDGLKTAMTLIRMGVLVHSGTSLNMCRINEEAVVNSLYEFLQLCSSKVRQMKSIPITDGISLYDFALRGMNSTTFSSCKLEDKIYSRVLQALLEGDFDIYEDLIECHFPILYLKKVLLNISLVSKNEINGRAIRISGDEVWLICDYLKQADMFQLIKASFEIVSME